MMELEFDPKADALSVRFGAAPVAESEEVAPGIILDFDAEQILVHAVATDEHVLTLANVQRGVFVGGSLRFLAEQHDLAGITRFKVGKRKRFRIRVARLKEHDLFVIGFDYDGKTDFASTLAPSFMSSLALRLAQGDRHGGL